MGRICITDGQRDLMCPSCRHRCARLLRLAIPSTMRIPSTEPLPRVGAYPRRLRKNAGIPFLPHIPRSYNIQLLDCSRRAEVHVHRLPPTRQRFGTDCSPFLLGAVEAGTRLVARWRREEYTHDAVEEEDEDAGPVVR